ncbi:MAG: serine hydrolase [Bacteroidales bacterium]|nr:serine hydrolase [Bacteroidales bacterium]
MLLRKVKILVLFLLLFSPCVLFQSSSEGEQEVLYNKVDSCLIRSLFITPEILEKYKEDLSKLLQNHNFNGNILLAIGGNVVFEESIGYADFPNRVKLDINSVFQLASVSKQFTAMGIAILKEKGLLDYDDLVKKHIPEFPYDNITIRHLLSHTSGLQNYIWLIDNEWKNNYSPDNEDVIDLFERLPLPLNFPPGSKFSYSNTGYVFLASVIERVGGKPFEEFMYENIFCPLNMENTFVYNKSKMDTLSLKAKGHVRRSGRYCVYEDDFNDGILGDKGVYSCVNDLYKWDLALYSDILLPKESMSIIFEKQLTKRGDTINYGMGWRLPKYNSPEMVYHNGWWHGYRSTLRRFTKDKNTLIILNNTNSNIFSLVNEIQMLMYPEMQLDTVHIE